MVCYARTPHELTLRTCATSDVLRLTIRKNVPDPDTGNHMEITWKVSVTADLNKINSGTTPI